MSCRGHVRECTHGKINLPRPLIARGGAKFFLGKKNSKEQRPGDKRLEGISLGRGQGSGLGVWRGKCVLVVRDGDMDGRKLVRDEFTDINGEAESRLKTHPFIQQMCSKHLLCAGCWKYN